MLRNITEDCEIQRICEVFTLLLLQYFNEYGP